MQTHCMVNHRSCNKTENNSAEEQVYGRGRLDLTIEGAAKHTTDGEQSWNTPVNTCRRALS